MKCEHDLAGSYPMHRGSGGVSKGGGGGSGSCFIALVVVAAGGRVLL